MGQESYLWGAFRKVSPHIAIAPSVRFHSKKENRDICT